MKKGFVIGLATGLTVAGASLVLANSQIQAILNNHIKVTLNGQAQEFKDETTNETQYPITYHNRTYLPLRTVANLVGVGIDYDANTNTAMLSTNHNNSLVTEKYNYNESTYQYVRAPYINIDSEDAKKVNKEIASNAERLIKAMKEDEIWTCNMEYQYFQYNNILSLYLKKIGFDDSGIYDPDDYTIYNFDINTGKLLNNNINILGQLKYNNLMNNIEKIYMIQLEEYIGHSVENLSGEYEEMLYNETKKSIPQTPEDIQCFYDSLGGINLIVKGIKGVGVGYYNRIINIDYYLK